MRIRAAFLCLLTILLFFACEEPDGSVSDHPRIFASDRKEIRKKIAKTDWAKASFERIRERIEPYADRHNTDPQWIVSRLAMYWKLGERYTQCYLKKQNWDYGQGDAPEPTVRMPGMRTWNQYANVPLEDRTPYNETGDMWGIDRSDPGRPPVLVPYKESGHMIRGNNTEILRLGADAAFLHWVTGEEKYARFAADIYYAWVIGTYYMNPILDPERSTGGPGGWEPGGICGYYDYEQIHDDLAHYAVPIYDFLYGYLEKNPHEHLTVLGQSMKEVSEIVFRRFIELGMIRGGRTGNWNVNGWNMILRPILALESDEAYPDGRGREYYLQFLTTTSTPHHEALPDILTRYDAVTGLWDESPGYSFSTISMLTDFAVLLQNAGIDIIGRNPIFQKAALAVLPWMDDQCNIVIFGDSRGGSADFRIFENLLSYYTHAGDTEHAVRVAGVLNRGIALGKYTRNEAGWNDICSFVQEIPAEENADDIRTAYSPHHRHITMKDFDGRFKLMATLYGGRRDFHLNENGLAVQFYGYGYALAPNTHSYVSYWTPDRVYTSTPTGSNTILPGYRSGEITVNRIQPAIPPGEFYYAGQNDTFYTYSDVSAAEKRRIVALVRIDDQSGYYVDIFASDLPDNDYIFRTVGHSLTLSSSGNTLETAPCELKNPWSEGYAYFSNPKKVDHSGDFTAHWEISDDIRVNFWHRGGAGRELYTVDAPAVSLNPTLTPGGVSSTPDPTPTLIIRQRANNAAIHPFAGIYEPYRTEPAVSSVESLSADPEKVALRVHLKTGSEDLIRFDPEKGFTIERKTP